MKNNFLKLMEYIKKSVKSQSEINYLKKIYISGSKQVC